MSSNKGAIAPARLTAMNSFRINSKRSDDTCDLVRSVLVFMTDAFMALDASADRGDQLSKGALSGAAEIMNLCADALTENEGEGSGDGG